MWNMLNDTKIIKGFFPYSITHKNNISNIISKTGSNAFIVGQRQWTCLKKFARANILSSCWFKALSYWLILLILNWFHYLWKLIQHDELSGYQGLELNPPHWQLLFWLCISLTTVILALYKYAALIVNFLFAYSAKCLSYLSITLDAQTSL